MSTENKKQQPYEWKFWDYIKFLKMVMNSRFARAAQYLTKFSFLRSVSKCLLDLTDNKWAGDSPTSKKIETFLEREVKIFFSYI